MIGLKIDATKAQLCCSYKRLLCILTETKLCCCYAYNAAGWTDRDTVVP